MIAQLIQWTRVDVCRCASSKVKLIWENGNEKIELNSVPLFTNIWEKWDKIRYHIKNESVPLTKSKLEKKKMKKGTL